MSWEDVYAKLKDTMFAEIKTEIGEVDLSGNIVSDILEIAEVAKDILNIADKYIDEISALSVEDQRELFIHGLDEAIKLPFWAESFDDNVLGVVWDWVQANRKKVV